MPFLPRRLLLIAGWCAVAAMLFAGTVAPTHASAAAKREQITVTTTSGQPVTFHAELAVTAAERARGLMGREDFGRGDAMLFVFERPAMRAFWMEGTPVSLDIIFFDAGGRWLNTAAHTTPYSRSPLPSAAPALLVLELAAGEAARLGIGEGSVIRRP